MMPIIITASKETLIDLAALIRIQTYEQDGSHAVNLRKVRDSILKQLNDSEIVCPIQKLVSKD